MSRKSAIWGGLTIGSILGGMVPALWGAGTFSMSAVFLSAIGSIVGIWIGFKISE